MTVAELIAILQKCDPDAIVMYDMENSLKNEAYCVEQGEYDLPCDELLIGGGTLKGFVFLREELLEE